MNCPTRRGSVGHPYTSAATVNANLGGLPAVAKGDYAINFGTLTSDYAEAGPQAPVTPAQQPSCIYPCNWQPPSAYNGVSVPHNEVAMSDIRDGTSNTYLVGEKCLQADQYFAGPNGDNETMYSGLDDDSVRTGCVGPWRDQSGYLGNWQFGSAHATTFQMVFCDGSVHAISYSINLTVHSNLSARNDGQVINAPVIETSNSGGALGN